MEVLWLAIVILGVGVAISKKRNVNNVDEDICVEDPTKTTPYFTRNPIFRNQESMFVNPQKGIRKTIVDNRGNIEGFPGFKNPEQLLGLLNRNNLPSNVEFRTSFEEQADGTYMMLWEVQPDGRYWSDEHGFGGTDDSEITLYSFIDEDGNFTVPFDIYQVGNEKYYQKS